MVLYLVTTNISGRKENHEETTQIGIAESQHESNLSSLKRRNFTEIQSAFQSTRFWEHNLIHKNTVVTLLYYSKNKKKSKQDFFYIFIFVFCFASVNSELNSSPCRHQWYSWLTLDLWTLGTPTLLLNNWALESF